MSVALNTCDLGSQKQRHQMQASLCQSLWRRSKRRSGNQCLRGRGSQVAQRTTPQHAYQRWIRVAASHARYCSLSTNRCGDKDVQGWLGSTAKQSHQRKRVQRSNDATHKCSVSARLLRKRYKRCSPRCNCGFHLYKFELQTGCAARESQRHLQVSQSHAD